MRKRCPKCNKVYTNKDYAKALIECTVWSCGLCFSTAKITDKLK